MKKMISLMIFLMSCSVCFAQGRVYQNQSSSGATQSQGVDKSVSAFVVMMKALKKSEAGSIPQKSAGGLTGYEIVTKNIFGRQDSCFYTDQQGSLLIPRLPNGNVVSAADPRVPARIWQNTDTDRIYEEMKVFTLKLPFFLVLSNITEAAWPTIQSRKMSEDAAIQYLSSKIDAEFDRRYLVRDDGLSDNPTYAYFDITNAMVLGGGGEGWFCGGSSQPGASDGTRVMKGRIMGWKSISDAYVMKFDGGDVRITKGGVEWISSSVLNGKTLSLSKSSRAENSTTNSRSTNQVR